MCKEDRCKVEDVFVVGFVFCYLFLNKRFVVFDLFLVFFMEEIEWGFIEGVEVNYLFDILLGEVGLIKLRYLVLFCIVDYLVMCELCKLKFCGKLFWRRCKCGFKCVSGELIIYYYGDYYRVIRFFWLRCVIEEYIF